MMASDTGQAGERRRLRYLVLTRWNPFGSLKGGDIDYSRGLIESLAGVGDVSALVFDHPDARGAHVPPEIHIQAVALRKRPKAASLLSGLPNVAFRHRDAAYLRAAIAGAATADVVIVDFIGMFWLVQALQRELRDRENRPAVIVVNHNVEADVRRQLAQSAQGAMRALLGIDAWKAARLERAANCLADGLTAITEPDRTVFASVAASPSIALSPGYDGPCTVHRQISATVPRRVAILGNFEAQHKRVALEQILDALHRAPVADGTSLNVVGAGDFSAFPPPPGVSFKGYVPDLASYLATVRLGALCDPIGGGFKLRVLTYAFCRVPMIALPEAIEGSGLRPGEHFIPVASPDELSSVIASVIDDFERLNAVQAAAFAYAQANYDWNERGRDLDAFARGLRSGADQITDIPNPEIAQ